MKVLCKPPQLTNIVSIWQIYSAIDWTVQDHQLVNSFCCLAAASIQLPTIPKQSILLRHCKSRHQKVPCANTSYCCFLAAKKNCCATWQIFGGILLTMILPVKRRHPQYARLYF